jgi:hypothetical protein
MTRSEGSEKPKHTKQKAIRKARINAKRGAKRGAAPPPPSLYNCLPVRFTFIYLPKIPAWGNICKPIKKTLVKDRQTEVKTVQEKNYV